MSAEPLTLRRPEGRPLPCPLQLLVAPGISRLADASLHSLTLRTQPCVSLLRTLATAFEAHLESPEGSHLEILNLFTSAKTFFPNKVLRVRAGVHLVLGGTTPPRYADTQTLVERPSIFT